MARDEDGIILPLVLVFLAVGLLLITPTLGHGYTALGSTRIAETRAQEVHAVDSGLEEGIRWLLADKPVTPGGPWSGSDGHWIRDTYPMNGKDVHVSVMLTETEHTYEIGSEVITSSGSPLTLFSRVKVVPGELPELEDLTKKSWPGDVYIPDGGTIPNGSRIGGSLFAEGDIVLMNGAHIDDGASISGNLTLSSGSKIDGTICVSAGEDGACDLIINNGSQPLDAVTVFVTLQDGESGTLVVGSGSGNAGLITMLYVIANGASTLDVTVNNGIIGDVYILSGGSASIMIATNSDDDINEGNGVFATTPDDVNYDDGDGLGEVLAWDGTTPEKPECPTWPKPVADVELYEFA